MNHEELAEALRKRGFSLTRSVRLTDAGRRKINVIKAVRALTNWGLKDAKEATDNNATIFESVSDGVARDAAEQLQSAGASVEIGLGEARLHAFDPDDGRRGNQPLERLRVHGLALALERGKLGTWEPQPLMPHSGAQLLAAIDEQLAAWSAAQRCTAATELELLEQVSARDLAAEQRMRAADAEDLLREATVYGDWLQSVGDPRGLLAAVDMANDRLVQLDAFAADNMPHLFGPTAALLDGAKWSWCGPVLESLTLGDGLRGRPCEPLAELLATPAVACLRSLTIEQAPEPDAGLGQVLSSAACAPGLRTLRTTGTTLGGDRFARLTTLSVRGHFDFARLRVPSLRSLDVDMSAPLMSLRRCFDGLDAPALEHFRLRIATYDYWDQNFGPLQSNLVELMREPSFTRLRSLCVSMNEGALPMTIGLADRIAEFPAIATLERIDLREAVLAPACRAELERSRERLPGLLLPQS